MLQWWLLNGGVCGYVSFVCCLWVGVCRGVCLGYLRLYFGLVGFMVGVLLVFTRWFVFWGCDVVCLMYCAWLVHSGGICHCEVLCVVLPSVTCGCFAFSSWGFGCLAP